MNVRWIGCLGLGLGLAIGGTAIAADKTQVKLDPDKAVAIKVDPANPESVVRGLYSPYLKGGDLDKSVFNNEAERDARLSAELSKLMRAFDKAQEKADEPGRLNFDPIINAQDFDIQHLEIRTDQIMPEKTAVIVVMLRNAGEQSKLKYKLVFERKSWRVDNIQSLYDPIWDLRDIIKGN